jgi:flagellar hook-associated protein 1 FlgK
MNIGMRAMVADNAALQVTSNNIANANVPGYSRQRAILATSPGQYTGSGFMGKGVDVVDVTRTANAFLTAQLQLTKSVSAMDETRSSQLQQLQNAFPTSDQDLSVAVGKFLSAVSDMANAPSDSSARQVVLARANDVAGLFANTSAQLSTMQSGVVQDLKNSAANVNDLASQIANINQKISAVKGLGVAPNDLLDQRDSLIGQISQLVQVSTVPASDGSMGVFIAGGQQLVLGGQASQMVVKPDAADPSRASLAVSINGQEVPLTSSMLSGGSIAGLMQFQNTDLVDARNLLGQMASAFAGEVNAVQSYGLDQGNPPKAGAPLFGIGAPQALAASTNQRDANGQFVGQVGITVTDPTQLQASEYSLSVDPSGPGLYQLTRLADGQTQTVSNGSIVDGFQINVGAALQAGDHFLLQPVGNAASGMKRVLDDPNGLAAASPVTALTSTANTGTASVASLQVVSAGIDPSQTVAINFTNATGAYDWSVTDANGQVVSSGSDQWQAGKPISLNGFELSLNGVPAQNDSITVAKTAYPGSNNGNALQIAALADFACVGRSALANGGLGGGETITDAYASAIANIGVRVQSATTSAQITNTAATQAQNAVASNSGVNLDEEAASLIQFQQSYQAAAKMLQVAQQVFASLLQIAGG